MIKIALPNITVDKNAKAHPYPFQIALQTKELIQGAIFYFHIADNSSGRYFQQQDATLILEKDFISHGGKKDAWEQGWELLKKYEEIFKITIYQNVLISINSYWDWYIRNLGSFVAYARTCIQSPVLIKREESNLNRISFLSINHQLALLEKACGVSFNISKSQTDALVEMSLVRNLALHNRWEVDKKYLENTPIRRQWIDGELRLFDIAELEHWHQCLLGALSRTHIPIAIRYLGAPPYPRI